MESLIVFLSNWGVILIVLIAAVIYALLDWKGFEKKVALGMLHAKSMAKDAILKSGQEQEDWVVKAVYPLLPVYFKAFINEQMFRVFIKKLYQISKDFADDGTFNGTSGLSVKPP